MPALGSKYYWTEERVNKLVTLAKIAEKRMKGNRNLNWEVAMSERPDIVMFFKKRRSSFYSKSWSRYRKVLNGICYRAGCFNKIESESVYCDSCRKENSLAGSRVRSKKKRGYYFRDNKDIIINHLSRMNNKELTQIAFEALGYMPAAKREKLLGKKFIKNLK